MSFHVGQHCLRMATAPPDAPPHAVLLHMIAYLVFLCFQAVVLLHLSNFAYLCCKISAVCLLHCTTDGLKRIKRITC